MQNIPNLINYEYHKFPDFYPVGYNLDKAVEFVNLAASKLPKDIGPTVNIWVRGSSGAILGTLLYQYIKVPCNLLHIKKPGENSHNRGTSLYYPNACNIIIDDLIESGETLSAILKSAEYHKIEFMDYLIASAIYDAKKAFQSIKDSPLIINNIITDAYSIELLEQRFKNE